MFYRVDYLLAVIFAGFLAGAALTRWSSRLGATRIARTYFVAVAILLALSTGFFWISVVSANSAAWYAATRPVSDLSNFFFGMLFGVAAFRADRRDILCDRAVYSILCIAAGTTFILTGYAKALYSAGMIEFFTQSGYSPAFLKFIMTAEILGGIGLLIPWTVLPAVAGLSIDMFGAIWTHVHNGDPLNDSTGAIGQLIRLAVIVGLWAWQQRAAEANGAVRRRLAVALAGVVLCAAIAVGGSATMRHMAGPLTQQPAHPAKTG